MKKLFVLLTALLLPLFAFEMNADEDKAVERIPLGLDIEKRLERTPTHIPIECYLYRMMSTVQTVLTSSDLGDVSLTVTNCSTGEVWYDFFDSALEPQTYLPISGSEGIYEIVYITESRDIYEGSFVIQ